MYTIYNYQTKKELRKDVEAGKDVRVFQPGPFGGQIATNGTVSLEGPHFPAAHTWYARATLQDGKVIKVK